MGAHETTTCLWQTNSCRGGAGRCSLGTKRDIVLNAAPALGNHWTAPQCTGLWSGQSPAGAPESYEVSCALMTMFHAWCQGLF